MRLSVLNNEPHSKGVDCHHKSEPFSILRCRNTLCSFITQARFQYPCYLESRLCPNICDLLIPSG